MDIRVVITDSGHADFIKLVSLLDEDLLKRYGPAQKQFDTRNRLDHADAAVLYADSSPAACGAYKKFDGLSVEIKRVFVADEHRRRGFGKQIMRHLEEHAKSKGYQYAVLETGAGQPEVSALYKKLGYEVIDNYGPYAGILNSVCMKKAL